MCLYLLSFRYAQRSSYAGIIISDITKRVDSNLGSSNRMPTMEEESIPPTARLRPGRRFAMHADVSANDLEVLAASSKTECPFRQIDVNAVSVWLLGNPAALSNAPQPADLCKHCRLRDP
jgi:hypothetical protein